MLLVATRARIVGREKSALAVAIVQLSQIGRASDDVVVRIIGICAEAVADRSSAQVSGMICIRPMAPLGDRARSIATTFRPHDGANPGRRDCEPLRCFRYEVRRCDLGRSGTLVALLAIWFGVRDTDGPTSRTTAAELHRQSRQTAFSRLIRRCNRRPGTWPERRKERRARCAASRGADA